MKRVLALIMAVCMLATLTASAFAFPVKSPTQGGLPTITVSDFLDENGNPIPREGEYKDCWVRLDITPYQDKDKSGVAGTVIQESLERAYDSYKNDFKTSARDMLNAAEPTGYWYIRYPGWDLRVVNIFDITLQCGADVHKYKSYDELLVIHGDHYVSMTLSDSDASNFIALMHYMDVDHDYLTTEDAYWELVPTTQKGNEIFFKVKCDHLSPFAIVVKTRTSGGGGGGGGSTTDEPTSPQTGEMGNGAYWMSCATFAVAVGVTALYRQKKEKRYAR